MRSLPSLFISLTAAAQVLLMAVTWPLWFSKTDFPQIAFWHVLDDVPNVYHQLLSAGVIAACLFLAVSQTVVSWRRVSSGLPASIRGKKLPCLILFCSIALVLLDQHRLQPWHWLTVLLMFEFLLLEDSNFVKAARMTFASIYVFAALSRFGPDVASGMSGQVLQVILQSLQFEWIKPSDNRFFVLATAMNAAEFFIGIALLFNQFSKAAVVAGVLLHGTLILCLSPLGLNHHVGVLVWNTFLLLAVPLLFWNVNRSKTITAESLAPKAKILIAVVVLIPTAGLFGLSDNWLAWQVYSPRPEVLKLTIDEDSILFLPASLRPLVQPPELLQSDCPIRLDRWSLRCKQVPIYPEDRFQIATAKAVVDESVKNGARRTAFKAQLEFPAHFPWWKRSTVDVPL